MNHSPELGELAKALIAAQAEFPAIPKGSNNPFFQSKYADLADVKAVADPIITKHGLAVSQHLGHIDSADVLTTILLHSSGQFISDSMKMHLVKQDPQGQGSATTYARRYAYMAVLGLVADNDDDGNAGSGNRGQNQNRQQNRNQQPAKRQPQSPKQERKANPETGEVETRNLTSLMMSELALGQERGTLISWLQDKHHCPISAVPVTIVAEVETKIASVAAGDPI